MKKDNILKTFWFWFIPIIGIVAIIVFLIVYCYLLKDETWENSAGDWINLFFGSLGTIATIELSYIAVWQTKKATNTSEKMFKMEELSKRSFLYLHKQFDYKQREIKSNSFLKNSVASSTYFIANINDKPDYKNSEQLTLYATIDKGEMFDFKIKELKYILSKNNETIFDIDKKVVPHISYDFDTKKFSIEIVFITKDSIFNILKSNKGYFKIVMEYENNFGIIEKRICELNFYHCLENNIENYKSFSSIIDNIAYLKEE